jgi:hypothetical protein
MPTHKRSYFLYSLTLPFVLIISVAIIAFTLWSIKTQPQNPSKIKSQTGALVIDHNSVALFEQIPDEYIQAASNMKVVFVDRSVGDNIDDYLTCLTYATDEASPIRCRRFANGTDPTYSVDRNMINWSRTGGYPRPNWQYYGWYGGGIPPELPCGVSTGMWWDLGNCFVHYVDANPTAYDVYSFQHSYLEVMPGRDIASPTTGYFVSQTGKVDISDMEALEARHPDKRIVYWTSSLARGIGTQESTDFNNQMRSYALAHNKILFDVADIESHDPYGNPCYDNRDGVAYGSENYPDDGLNLPAICQHYTTEFNGGHLGATSIGGIRLAKAFWVLMAQLAGWSPDGTPLPTLPESTNTPTSAPLPTATSTPIPTSTSIPTPLPTPEPPQGGGLVYHLNFDNEGTFGNCTNCTRYNTTLTGGVLGSAFDFNGTSSYIDANYWPYIKGENQFTFAVWLRPDFEENDINRHYVVSDGQAFIIFNLTQINGWRVRIRLASSSPWVNAENLNWVPGTWHHMAVTYDNSVLKIYWDGELKGSNPASGIIRDDSFNARIGQLLNYEGMYWDGAMDELKIFNYALSDSEVQSLYSNP